MYGTFNLNPRRTAIRRGGRPFEVLTDQTWQFDPRVSTHAPEPPGTHRGDCVALPVSRPSYPPKRRTLQLYRKASGLTQGALARRMVLSTEWIAHIEARSQSWWSKDVHRKQFEHFLDSVDLASMRAQQETE